MKRELTTEDFAVGDVVISCNLIIAQVVDIRSGNRIAEIWCKDLWVPAGICEPWQWWELPRNFTILASPLALAKRYCGYKET